jgi:hypothetical protein
MEVCHGPMDVICADAVREILSYGNTKPVILAETGAVEPMHAGPSQYYAKDTVGIILHDALFAPFFSGAAGPGMIWHWDQYVAKNNLWHHFDRFAQVVKALDPVAQQLKPFFFETEDLRVYGLKGKSVFFLWCRDKTNTWETELKDGMLPRQLNHSVLDLEPFPELLLVKSIESFDPWKNYWEDVDIHKGQLSLPEFQRSIIIKGILN